MADAIRVVEYFYVTVSNKPGEGARLLDTLRRERVNLLAFSAFPAGRKSQADFVPEDAAAFRRAAKKAKWKVKGPKKGFLVQGDDRVGAVADLIGALARREDQHHGAGRRECPRPLRRDLLGGAEGSEESDEGCRRDERPAGGHRRRHGDAGRLGITVASNRDLLPAQRRAFHGLDDVVGDLLGNFDQ